MSDNESAQLGEDQGAEQVSKDRQFGPTEYGLVRVGPEDWTPSQRLAAFVVGGMAIMVGVMGLLGISIYPRDRR